MAAAAWSRSRGVAGVRPTTGLFSIFTLLCLVCLSSSLMDKDQLEKFKEQVQKLQKQLDEVKAIYESEMGGIKDLLEENKSLMKSLEPLVKAKEEEFPEHSLFLQGFLQGKKHSVETTKNKVDKKDEEMRAQIENKEMELERLKNLITFHEEQQAEL